MSRPSKRECPLFQEILLFCLGYDLEITIMIKVIIKGTLLNISCKTFFYVFQFQTGLPSLYGCVNCYLEQGLNLWLLDNNRQITENRNLVDELVDLSI